MAKKNKKPEAKKVEPAKPLKPKQIYLGRMDSLERIHAMCSKLANMVANKVISPHQSQAINSLMRTAQRCISAGDMEAKLMEMEIAFARLKKKLKM